MKQLCYISTNGSKKTFHERLKSPNSKDKSEEPVKQKVGTKVFASNAKVSDKTTENPKFPK